MIMFSNIGSYIIKHHLRNNDLLLRILLLMSNSAIKSVSPVKPCKVVQKQGSPICMKFCEQVT